MPVIAINLALPPTLDEQALIRARVDEFLREQLDIEQADIHLVCVPGETELVFVEGSEDDGALAHDVQRFFFDGVDMETE